MLFASLFREDWLNFMDWLDFLGWHMELSFLFVISIQRHEGIVMTSKPDSRRDKRIGVLFV